ncbi:MAG: 50S ribosomal protein L18 [Acidobacteria bacterium]|nr:50S ribosomal protein L18 [Acidobacteriota bacterium]
MIAKTKKNEVRQRVHKRIRRKLMGTPQRPRLNVYRSLNHIYAQLVDDMQGRTLVAANSLERPEAAGKGKRPTGGNLAAAKSVGKNLAERARQQGISKIVFDRGGYLYHGRIKALADAAREAGLQF